MVAMNNGLSRTAAKAAFTVGGLYAGVSLYWALGGTRLLTTVGGSLANPAYSGRPAVILALWAAIALKAVAAVLPLVATRRRALRGPWERRVRVAAWLEAVILTLYGLAQTAVGLLVQAGVVPAAGNADHRALAWHAYLWDPWFLAWGLLVLVAIARSRTRAIRIRKPARPQRHPGAGSRSAATRVRGGGPERASSGLAGGRRSADGSAASEPARVNAPAASSARAGT
jgi:Protein of unknown function (DUF3995)